MTYIQCHHILLLNDWKLEMHLRRLVLDRLVSIKVHLTQLDLLAVHGSVFIEVKEDVLVGLPGRAFLAT